MRFRLTFFVSIKEAAPKNSSYYGNRAAAYMMLKKYKESLNDTKNSTLFDDKFVKVVEISFYFKI
jgi:hypothetical protein